jgi:hypothetical protein
VRYHVPVFFLDSRPLAEEWVFRFLDAALAQARAEAAACTQPNPPPRGTLMSCPCGQDITLSEDCGWGRLPKRSLQTAGLSRGAGAKDA